MPSRTYVRTYVRTYTCTTVHTRVRTYMYVYVCVYTHTLTHTHTHTHTHTRTTRTTTTGTNTPKSRPESCCCCWNPGYRLPLYLKKFRLPPITRTTRVCVCTYCTYVVRARRTVHVRVYVYSTRTYVQYVYTHVVLHTTYYVREGIFKPPGSYSGTVHLFFSDLQPKL